MSDLFDRDTLRKDIILRLCIMQECLKWHSQRGENDACKTAEDVVARLLAVLCGWNLVNLNTIKKNYPAADLGDAKERIAVQVTVNGTPQKVLETHQKAIAHKLGADFDRLIILFLLPTVPSDPKSLSPSTKPTVEKWGRPKIDSLIDQCTTEKLRGVHAILAKEMSAIGDILQPILPLNNPVRFCSKLRGGHVVITSRLIEWGRTVHPLPLEVLSLEDAAALLLESAYCWRRPRPDPDGHSITL